MLKNTVNLGTEETMTREPEKSCHENLERFCTRVAVQHLQMLVLLEINPNWKSEERFGSLCKEGNVKSELAAPRSKIRMAHVQGVYHLK